MGQTTRHGGRILTDALVAHGVSRVSPPSSSERKFSCIPPAFLPGRLDPAGRAQGSHLSLSVRVFAMQLKV